MEIPKTPTIFMITVLMMIGGGLAWNLEQTYSIRVDQATDEAVLEHIQEDIDQMKRDIRQIKAYINNGIG